MSSSYRDEQRGATSGIQDSQAGKEIKKLWSVLEARLGGDAGDKTLITRADLDALKRSLASTPTSVSQVAAPATGGGSASGDGQTGTDLLTSLNFWLNNNVFQKVAAVGFPSAMVSSLGTADGQLVASSPTILSYLGYSAALDVRRSTDWGGVDPGLPGGRAAIYVQHRVQGNLIGSGINTGISVSLETKQTAVGSFSGALGLNIIVAASSANVQSWGALAQMQPSGGSSQTVTIGFAADVYRASAAGLAIGMQVRPMDGYQKVDAGFLVAPSVSGSANGVTLAFSAGDAVHGKLRADIGLDLSYCTCDFAAICVPANKVISLNGPTNRQGLYYKSNADAIRFFGLGGDTLEVSSLGTLTVVSLYGGETDAIKIPAGASIAIGNGFKLWSDGSGANLGNAAASFSVLNNGTLSIFPPTATTAGASLGYVKVKINGVACKIQYFADS